jgi:hypothetical protein
MDVDVQSSFLYRLGVSEDVNCNKCGVLMDIGRRFLADAVIRVEHFCCLGWVDGTVVGEVVDGLSCRVRLLGHLRSGK